MISLAPWLLQSFVQLSTPAKTLDGVVPGLPAPVDVHEPAKQFFSPLLELPWQAHATYPFPFGGFPLYVSSTVPSPLLQMALELVWFFSESARLKLLQLSASIKAFLARLRRSSAARNLSLSMDSPSANA